MLYIVLLVLSFLVWLICLVLGGIVSPQSSKKTVLIGAAALCWAVWISHNDVIIENCTTKLSFAGHLQSDLSNFPS